MDCQMLAPHVPVLDCRRPHVNPGHEALRSMAHADRTAPVINLPAIEGLPCRPPLARSSSSRSTFRPEDGLLRSHLPSSQLKMPPRPPSPRPWVWICHFCRNKWPLGATRRCLYDGHYYCAGQRAATLGKRKRGPIMFNENTCTSEFDYSRWADMTKWRRKIRNADHKTLTEYSSTPATDRNCWDQCSFPSACRIIRTWGISEGRIYEDSSSDEDACDDSHDAKRTKLTDVIHHT